MTWKIIIINIFARKHSRRMELVDILSEDACKNSTHGQLIHSLLAFSPTKQTCKTAFSSSGFIYLARLTLQLIADHHLLPICFCTTRGQFCSPIDHRFLLHKFTVQMNL